MPIVVKERIGVELKKGDRVRHPKKQEWGVGEVIQNSENARVRILFRHGGEKIFPLTHVDLIQLQRGGKVVSELDQWFERELDRVDQKRVEEKFAGEQFTTLYYIKIIHPSEGTYYKLGITDHDVYKRFSGEDRRIQIFRQGLWRFRSRVDAERVEQKLLSMFVTSIVPHNAAPRILRIGGNTELFRRDIFKQRVHRKKGSQGIGKQLIGEVVARNRGKEKFLI